MPRSGSRVQVSFSAPKGCPKGQPLFFCRDLNERPLSPLGTAARWRLQSPLNPQSLRDFPLSGGHRLHYIPAGGSTAAIFKENLADVPPRRLMHAKPALPLNPSRLQRQPLSGDTASALLQRASPLFDFLRKSHCRSNAARGRAHSNVDFFYV